MLRVSFALALLVAAAGCRSRLLAAGDGGSSGGGDLAGGGAPDLALPEPYSRLHIPVDCAVDAIATGDFDGDGHGDLALACATTATSGTVLVLVGAGDGTFSKLDLGGATAFADFEHVVAGDLDGDGAPDVIATSATEQRADEIVSIAAFPKSAVFSLAGRPTGLALADFDGDGRPDWAVAAQQGTAPELDWALGGNGFGTTHMLKLDEVQVRRLVAGDFDGDGKVDVAVGSSLAHVTLLRGDGKDGFALLAQVSVPDGVTSADVLAAGDLDGDGLPDIVVAGEGAGLFLLTDHGGLTARRIAQPMAMNDAAIADLDGDGLADIVVADGAAAFLIRQGANGKFDRLGALGPASGAAAVAVADENGDHLNDIVVGSNGAIDVFLQRAP